MRCSQHRENLLYLNTCSYMAYEDVKYMASIGVDLLLFSLWLTTWHTWMFSWLYCLAGIRGKIWSSNYHYNIINHSIG